MKISQSLSRVLLLLALSVASLCHAQQTPDAARVLRIVVPFAAGTPLDAFARIMATKMADGLGRPVIVDNKPGAAGVIGTREVVKSSTPRDVLLFTVHSSVVVNPYLYKNLGYDQKELEPVALVGVGSYLLVTSSQSGLKTVDDIIAAAKATPNTIRYGSYGVGSGPHLCMEMFQKATGAALIHVPYKASPLNDLVGGNIELSMEPVAGAIPFVDDGRVNAIGYTTTLKTGRPKAPIPSVAERVKGFECGNWVGILAQTSAGPEFANRIHDEVEKVLSVPEIRQKIQEFGLEPQPMTRAAFRNFVDQEHLHWAKVVRDANVKME